MCILEGVESSVRVVMSLSNKINQFLLLGIKYKIQLNFSFLIIIFKTFKVISRPYFQIHTKIFCVTINLDVITTVHQGANPFFLGTYIINIHYTLSILYSLYIYVT